MSNCAVNRQRSREKHVENPSTDSPVKDLTNMQLNMFSVCATGAFQPKTRSHRHGDVPQHHPQHHATCTPQACTFTDVSATTHKKACEVTSTTTTQRAQTFSVLRKHTEKNVPNMCLRRPGSQRLTTQQLCEGPTLLPRLKNPSRHGSREQPSSTTCCTCAEEKVTFACFYARNSTKPT